MNSEKLLKFQSFFKNHVLTVEHESEELKVYKFANPNEFHLWQRWIFSGSKLIVVGDCYDSIYSNGPFNSIVSASQCNLSYFSGKCSADMDGHYQSNFDGDYATSSIHEMICEKYDELEIFSENDDIEKKLISIELHLEENPNVYNTDIPRGFDDEYDTITWLRENPQIVGEDWYDGLYINKKNNHPFFHLAAIKEAAKKL